MLSFTSGGYSHIWTIQGCAAQQGMVFASPSLEQGLQISVSVWNRVCFLPCDSGIRRGYSFCYQESRCKWMWLLFLLGSCCTFTQTRCFQLEGEPCLTFFSLEQGTYFHLFCLEQGSKIASLVWNRVRFSGTQRHTPILNWGEYPPGGFTPLIHRSPSYPPPTPKPPTPPHHLPWFKSPQNF